ncbi:YqaA family protein [Oharaeibacter diazotrophicus]|uniref:Membrane protein YqaA with SNARE-associated domain n=1 Tax=Oharaeibacter diazotrophicus TaxID=1920512 RepID=A0A4R6RKF1_9HYPH|nr:YqaA family protein [Oharaeibacter diazotrophicus]TDP86585.1 membrane protein YqaA with SNARE-associated domain [Oharaeibacter diazotrophicus]BBE71473.1 SNARE associated Golgi protein [Pleomorphomonas sp. SM30]GLS78234.1 cytochrome b561 [Oharaeibacter diazotrophicus]
MLRQMYGWTMSLAAGRHAPTALAAVSFAESSFFPIPPDVLLVPMVLARRERAYVYAAICTAASVLGGALGYAIGVWLFGSLGQWLISAYGLGDDMAKFQASYAEWGAAIILLKGLTPIPYKLVTIASGFAGYDFPLFLLLSAITRGARFFLEAALLRRYGEPVRDFIENRLEWVMLAVAVTIVGGFLLVRLI